MKKMMSKTKKGIVIEHDLSSTFKVYEGDIYYEEHGSYKFFITDVKSTPYGETISFAILNPPKDRGYLAGKISKQAFFYVGSSGKTILISRQIDDEYSRQLDAISKEQEENEI
tara:strand:- start:8177 stop:8515 length:339 start_codon:yes stop_codon:yes gene_type:complete